MTSYTSAMSDSWASKLSGESWQTPVGREFHIQIAHGKKVCPKKVSIHAGTVLHLHLSCFVTYGANWYYM